MLGAKAPPKLEDVLKYNNGKVGVVVDAKEAHIFYSEYRKNLCNILNKYAKIGEIMLQSFNPILMLNLKNKLKGVLTAQLICRGKTITDTFKTRKTIGYSYERIISLICFISSTDVINMENHSDSHWTKFIGKRFSKFSLNKTSKVRRILPKLVDKIQLDIIKTATSISKKPVLVYTIRNKEDLGKMGQISISNYIADYSIRGVEEYIKMIKEK